MTDKEKNTTATTEKASKVRVQTNPKTVHEAAAYYDPEQKKTIGRKPITVEETALVGRLLLSGALIRAK